MSKPITLISLALLGFSFAAHAGTSTGTFQVTASVAKSCNIGSTSDVAFGAYAPAGSHLATPLDASGSVSIVCTKGTTYEVTLDQGLNPAGGSTCASPQRRMAAGSERLAYQLYRDSARTQIWGCDASNLLSGTATTGPSSPENHTVYGRIPPGQDVADGSFSDTITVTVNF